MIKNVIKEYKWVILAGIIVGCLILLITSNLNVLQLIGYKIEGNNQGIMTMVESELKHTEEGEGWVLQEGLDYLIQQPKYTEDLVEFFNTQFEGFTLERKQEIIGAYNRKKLVLPMTDKVATLLIEHREEENIKSYIKRLESQSLEQALVYYYGNQLKIDKSTIISLAEILKLYPNKIEHNNFNINFYDLLTYSGEELMVQKKLIMAKFPQEKVRESVFKQIKDESLTETQICSWVEFLNDTNIITPAEYTSFNNLYSEITLIRNQYKLLDDKKVALQDKKKEVELKIEASVKELQQKQTELDAKQADINAVEAKIEELTNYTHMALFIEGASGTGDNEYIASVPRRGLFGFKPSDQKYVVKLDDLSLANGGMKYLDVYYKGTKQVSNGDEYVYYTQVKASELEEINSKEIEREQLLVQRDTLKKEAQALEEQIESIKKENNYEENEKALIDIVKERETLSASLAEKTLKIKELFGLKELKILLEGEA